MEQQLEEAVALGVGTARARRAAEARAAAADARADAADAAAARGSGGGSGGAAAAGERLELRNLREELAAQEAAVAEARELTGYARCASRPRAPRRATWPLLCPRASRDRAGGRGHRCPAALSQPVPGTQPRGA